MTLSEKIFTLKSMQPFDLLREGEIMLIAQVTHLREYPADHLIASAERPIRRLHIVARGEVHEAGREAALPVFGVKPLLFNQSGHGDLIAGPTGATCLTIKRGNFFTVANECPALIVGFLQLADQGQLL